MVRVWLIAIVTVLSFAPLGSAQDDLDIEFYSYTEESLFPSAIIATALTDWDPETQTAEDHRDFTESNESVPLYGDENGWLGVNLTGLPPRAQVEIVIGIDRILKPSRWSGKMKKGHTEVLIMPKLAWDYDALHQVREERPVTVDVSIKVNGEMVKEQTETCVLKSINDCPFYVLNGDEVEDLEDLSVVFAAYVNENHPLINGILKDALATEIVSSFSGYQSGDPAQVLAQVYAVWMALHERGISYSDISTTTPSSTVVSQTVRFLDESIKSQQANCVDGSVMLASVLRKIGLNVQLVMVPGHCLLAFDLDREGTAMLGLETTTLGDMSGEDLEDLPALLANLPAYDSETGHTSFAKAILLGTKTVAENAEKFESVEDPNTQLISIAEAREMGIRPIAMKQGTLRK